ncbi:glutathionylspermidine synthase family protein [Sabulicella rubraurantiaca]|uniref:glutathionylspermidine synthase family protein n=1 Tax=Sabulicella rubraurantiaca TaxID=2811429 RepID=UPI001A9582FA|nr:glutathionylspermidine synthase family protein [Sabulicella rubraurantiaca]
MERIEIAPRQDWAQRVAHYGLAYHSHGEDPAQTQKGGGLWWHEGAFWKISEAEADLLDDATAELHNRCLDALDFLMTRAPSRLQSEWGWPQWFIDAARASWRDRDPALMGRMDLAFDDERGAVKLLEINADTPTLCIETALVQWNWLEDCFPGSDQFNSLHEKLLVRFKDLALRTGGAPIHFAAYLHLVEEALHSIYWQDLARQAGITAIGLDLGQIGSDGTQLLDEDNNRIAFLHKLYPWEWAIRDEFGPLLASRAQGVLEPPWKAALSDKAILALLHEMFPDHPHILPAFLGRHGEKMGQWVEKPCLGREGQNIRMTQNGKVVEATPGEYGTAKARWITQACTRLSQKDGWNAVIGSWVVGEGETGGIIFREARTLIMRDGSRVVPHLMG